MHKNAIKMVWGVKIFLKNCVALFLALFGENVAHLNLDLLTTLRLFTAATVRKLRRHFVTSNLK